MRLDHAREALEAVLNDLRNPSLQIQKDELSNTDREGDVKMSDGTLDANGEVVTIPIAIDDELSDIPAEMRETVAKEIASFRDRSNRRDLERLKREEEIEQQERHRNMNGDRYNRLASPPPSAPAGPAGTNGIPSGPRGAPAGPKGFGTQIPRDYQKGVTFVNGTAINGSSAFEDEDNDASDEELERRRKDRKDAELEKQFLDQERRWLNRERSRTAAVEREQARDGEEDARLNDEKDTMRKRLHDWNDDIEANRKVEEYYADRSNWIRNRAGFRQHEIANDDADRAAEQRERARDHHQQQRVGALADDFLSRQEAEMAPREQVREEEESRDQRRGPAPFKLSLGMAAASKAAAQNALQANKRTVAEVEGLLEDEEEDSKSGARRTLIPIQYDASTTAGMTEEERAQAARQLAADIPNDKDGLWSWNVKWEFVDESVIDERLKPFVEKKIVEYLGVQEQMLVDVVVTALTTRGKPQDLVGELEGVSLIIALHWCFVSRPKLTFPFLGPRRRSRSTRAQAVAYAHFLLRVGEERTCYLALSVSFWRLSCYSIHDSRYVQNGMSTRCGQACSERTVLGSIFNGWSAPIEAHLPNFGSHASSSSDCSSNLCPGPI